MLTVERPESFENTEEVIYSLFFEGEDVMEKASKAKIWRQISYYLLLFVSGPNIYIITYSSQSIRKNPPFKMREQS